MEERSIFITQALRETLMAVAETDTVEKESVTCSGEKGNDDASTEREGDLLLAEEVDAEVALPPMVKVIIHNDNYTAMDFVVKMLKKYFHKSALEAKQIMLNVHKNGYGVAGVYVREIAETKIFQVTQEAKQNEFPLRLSIEDEK